MTNKIWPEKFHLNNKIVIVAGIGLIGTEIINGVAEAGAKVIIADIDEEKAKKFEKKKKENGMDITYKKLDITNEESIDNFLSECKAELKTIDAWINSTYPRTPDWGNKEKNFNFSHWKENINLHLGGYYLSTIRVAELMKMQGGGAIVNIGSIYGVSAPDFSIYEGTEMTMPISYAVIKGGINMLTKYVATYYGKDNVRANVICPGGVYNKQPEIFINKYNKRVPLGRMALAEEIAGPAIFLVSDAASYITGQILMVDGGLTAW